MFSKSFIASVFLLTLTSSVNAHAAIAPALGVKGNPVRNDVQRPSGGNPCGNVDIAKNIDTSTPVVADAAGKVSASITNFNPGADGSRSIKTVQVDASGTGKNFVAAQMLVNGDAAPTDVSTQPLSIQLPANTKCTGGAGKNLCIASFTTTSGFGNCVAVSQGGQAANPTPSGAAKGVKRATPEGQQEAVAKKKGKKGGKKTVSTRATPEAQSNEAAALNNEKQKGNKGGKKKAGKNDKKKAVKGNKGSKRHWTSRPSSKRDLA